jgi:hypothetical protein
MSAPETLTGPATTRPDVAPLEVISAEQRARLAVHEAASGWTEKEVRILARVIALGTPLEVLAALGGRGVEQGGGQRPTTPAHARAMSCALELYRLMDVGGAVLGPPQGGKAR